MKKRDDAFISASFVCDAYIICIFLMSKFHELFHWVFIWDHILKYTDGLLVAMIQLAEVNVHLLITIVWSNRLEWRCAYGEKFCNHSYFIPHKRSLWTYCDNDTFVMDWYKLSSYKSISTRFGYKFATNQAIWLIFAAFKRWDPELLNDATDVQFGWIGGNLHWN